MGRKKINSCILYAVAVLALLGVDQYTKYLATAYLKDGRMCSNFAIWKTKGLLLD